jgi:PAS domain S-box-containing protein
MAVNEANGAAAALFIAACGCSLLSLGINDPSHSVGAIAWLTLIPTALYSGRMIVASRWRSFGSDAELTSP